MIRFLQSKILLLLLLASLSINANAQDYLKYFEFVDAKADDNLITLAKKETPKIFFYNNPEEHKNVTQSLKDKGYLKIGSFIGHPSFNTKANKKYALKEAKKVGATAIFTHQFIGSDFYVLQKNPPPVVEEPEIIVLETAKSEINSVQNVEPIIGVELRNLTIEERQEIERNKGAYIINVVDDSPAFESNVIPGDILIKVNGLQIKDTLQAIQFIAAADTKDGLILTVIRKGSEREIIIKF